MIKRLVSLIIVGIFFSVGISFCESAEVLYTLDKEYANCVFQVDWENTKVPAHVKITSPQGDSFGSQITPDRITKRPGKIMINVGKASVGQWKVEIEGNKLGNVDISGGQVPTSLAIENIDVIEKDKFYWMRWTILGDRGDLEYKVFLDTDNQGFDGIEVDSFTSKDTIKKETVNEKNVEIKGISTGKYYVYMKVKDRSGIFTYAYSEPPIYHVNSEPRKKRLENVFAALLNDDVYIKWDPDGSYEFKVMLFDPETNDLISEETTSDYSHVMAVPDGYEKVLAGVAPIENEGVGNYEKHEVIMTNGPEAEVKYPDKEAVNTDSILVNIDFEEAYSIFITVNNRVVLDNATEAGEYILKLDDGENNVVVLITDENGDMATFKKNIYVDTTAPQLSITRDIDQLEVEDDIIYIEGYTEAGSTLFCNDKEVEKVNNHFSIEYELEGGENSIQIRAVDIAGNESRYTASVFKKSNYKKLLKLGVLILMAAFILVFYGVLIVKSIRKGKDNA